MISHPGTVETHLTRNQGAKKGRTLPTIEDTENAYRSTGWEPETCVLADDNWCGDGDGVVGCLAGVLAANLMNLGTDIDRTSMDLLHMMGELTVAGFYNLTRAEVHLLEQGFDGHDTNLENLLVKRAEYSSLDKEKTNEAITRGWEIGRAIFGETS